MEKNNSHTKDSILIPEKRTRTIVFLILPNVQLLDLSGPAQVFDVAHLAGAPYTLRYCSSQPTQRSAQGVRLTDLAPLPALTADDLVLVPGTQRQPDTHNKELLDQKTRDWLAATAQGGTHIASICRVPLPLEKRGCSMVAAVPPIGSLSKIFKLAFLGPESLIMCYLWKTVPSPPVRVLPQGLIWHWHSLSGIRDPCLRLKLRVTWWCIYGAMALTPRRACILSIGHTCIQEFTRFKITSYIISRSIRRLTSWHRSQR